MPRCQASRSIFVDAVGPPDGQHVDHAATAYIDHVLVEQMVADVADPAFATEEGDVGGMGGIAEGVVEAHYVVIGVTAGGRQEADPRPDVAGQRAYEVVEQRVSRLHGEAPASEGDDLAFLSHGRIFAVRSGSPFGPASKISRLAIVRQYQHPRRKIREPERIGCGVLRSRLPAAGRWGSR